MDPVLEAMGTRGEMVRLLSGPRAQIQVNAPLALMQQAAEAEANLLARLFGKGLLNTDAALNDLLAQLAAQIRANKAQRDALDHEAQQLARRENSLLRRIRTTQGEPQ
jgi:hypothetical protein